MIAIAVDHSEEADNVAKRQQDLYQLKLSPKDKKGNLVEIYFRIDATGTPKKGSHVRLTTTSLPSNVLVGNNYSIDALVAMSETGRARFECLHPLPSYFEDCSWILEDCGPFVTSKSMIDTVNDLCIYQEDCCGVANIIFGLQSPNIPRADHSFSRIERLNHGQNQAIKLALNSPLLCLWGPPGTGKTETTVEMICALQTANPKARVLVTAPTHNAVDNVMRRYIQRLQKQPLARKTQPDLVRASTEVRKVADDLRKRPWKWSNEGNGTEDYERAIFINCDAKEMPGPESKESRGQAELCLHICKLLTNSPETEAPTLNRGFDTIYSPSRKRMLASIPYKIEISTIDGFQGRVADIVFLTVRCNEHRKIGFLGDIRRMNVALTQVRSALIVVGNRATLTEGTADEESAAMWRKLLGILTKVKLEAPVKDSVKKD
ncbi:NAM7-nonsense-mediated mRNA decay [Fusarium acutatum]|uniref:NAM7-nonsense-mediated mRNA decay n=1 Tax=Fusarium acutatum TaxID=78861 RepID=A0A8H4JCZ0_9HYPO|nr:NAM7-nonsense-mediated mRNA decay [Fusarium acutatum]